MAVRPRVGEYIQLISHQHPLLEKLFFFVHIEKFASKLRVVFSNQPKTFNCVLWLDYTNKLVPICRKRNKRYSVEEYSDVIEMEVKNQRDNAFEKPVHTRYPS